MPQFEFEYLELRWTSSSELRKEYEVKTVKIEAPDASAASTEVTIFMRGIPTNPLIIEKIRGRLVEIHERGK